MKPRTPRICFNALLLQDPLDGIGNYCFHLIRSLMRLHPDWKVSVLVNKAAARHFEGLGDSLEIIALDITRTDARLVYLHAVFPFRAFRFDIVHSIANAGLLFCPVPQVITVHDAYEHVKPDRMTRMKRAQILLTKSVSGKKACAIIAVSENTREDLARFYPDLRDKTRVVRQGSKFPLASSPGQNRRNFLAHGTLDTGRNLTDILEAYARYSGRGVHKLVLFGVRSGGKEASLPALLDSLGIRDRVELRGYVSDEELAALYRHSIAFIRAQDYDGFGLPAIEAMSCGCPAVLARNSSLIEVGGDAAVFFETRDVADLAAQLERFDDPEWVEDRARRSLEHARGFTWEKNAGEVAAIYLQCLKKNEGGRHAARTVPQA